MVTATGFTRYRLKPPDWNVTFYIPKSISPADVFATSRAIKAAASLYTEESYIPEYGWSPLTSLDAEELAIPHEFSMSSDVALVKLPRDLHCRLEVATRSNLTDLGLTVTDENALREWLRSFSKDGVIDLHKARPVSANMQTTTRDEHGRLIGLHLDNWDKLPLPVRNLARNRLCVNIGPAPRFFVIIPITVASLIVNGRIPPHVEHGAFKAIFFSVFPDAPVIRMRIDPGFAYIAPTENLIHDASSLGFEVETCVVTARGSFLI